MLETVRVARRLLTQGVHYTSRDRRERQLFEELVLNNLAKPTVADETLNGRDHDITARG